MVWMGVYLEFRMNFDKGVDEWFREPPGVVAIGFSNSFVRIMKPMKARGSFMNNSQYNK